MRQLDLCNPFNAPVFHEETVGSTMDVSRLLAGQGAAPHGTVVCADFQGAGKGRIPGRQWNTGRMDSLLFTVLLRFRGVGHIPKALTLRVGLAVALAIEDFAPTLRDRVMVKWPNDIMLPAPGSRPGSQGSVFGKAVGILAEADGGNVHVGIGVNVTQKEFPPGLQGKATSVALATDAEIESGRRFVLLEKILARLRLELEPADAAETWRKRIEARLYMRGEKAGFAEGIAGSAVALTGTISGIGPDGELLIVPDGETGARAFVSGELRNR